MPSSLDGLSVLVAMPCVTDPTLPTTISLLDTQEACAQFGVTVDFAFVTGSLVHNARTLAANKFIESNHNRLFWIDADMKWSAVDFMKLLVHSNTHDCVVGIYPRRADPPGYYVKLMDGEEPSKEGLVRIEGTGLGFACIKRGVIVHLANLAPTLRHGPNQEPKPSIFRCDDDGTDVRGEDYAFWADVREAGYKIYADTTIALGHVGRKVYQCGV